MSPARREAVFWAADAATGAAAVSAAPVAVAASLRVNVPGLRSMSGSFNQDLERAAVCAATAKSSRIRRVIIGSLMDRCGAPKDGAAAALGISRTRRTYKTTLWPSSR